MNTNTQHDAVSFHKPLRLNQTNNIKNNLQISSLDNVLKLAALIEDNNRYFLKTDSEKYSKIKTMACLRYTVSSGHNYYDLNQQQESLEGLVDYYAQTHGVEFDNEGYKKAVVDSMSQVSVHRDSDYGVSGEKEAREVIGMSIDTLTRYFTDPMQKAVFLSYWSEEHEFDTSSLDVTMAEVNELLHHDNSFIKEPIFHHEITTKMKDLIQSKSKATL